MSKLTPFLLTSAIATACGGSPPPAAAVGQVGGSLSSHTHSVPAGAEVCAMKEALAEAPKPNDAMAKTCDDAKKRDALWRGTMLVLAAYGESLGAVAAGGDEATTGQLEAALTGVEGTGWADAKEAKETAARDAASELVTQMSTDWKEGGFEARVKAAAPHVKAICEGLEPYLDEQTKELGAIQTDVEAKKKTPLARRCAMLNNAPVCVSDSMADRMVYASAFGRLATLEASHRTASRAVAGFCAAHEKLEAAAEAGKAEDEATYKEVVQAVRDAVAGVGAASAGSEASGSPTKGAPPATGAEPAKSAEPPKE